MNVILTCEFKLECNRFLGTVTTKRDFENRIALFCEEDIRKHYAGSKVEIPSFLDVFDPLPDYTIRPVFALNAQPGPPVAKEVYDLAVSMLLTAIRQEKEAAARRGKDPSTAPAALLLSLHGAMVAEGHEDAEGDFLEAARTAVGPDCPIFATLDLHANLTRKKVRNATALFPIEYYPHTDFYENGLKAAHCLIDTLEGRVRPAMAMRTLPLLFPTLPTSHESFVPFREKIARINEEPGILTARFTHGFFAADVSEGSAAVLVVTDGDQEKAQAVADELGEEIYANRRSFFRKTLSPDDAVREALRLLQSGVHAPIVLAEVNDNPGSGSTMDVPSLIEALIRKNVPSMVSALCDPESVEKAYEAGIGAELEFALGGKTRPELTGGPIRAIGKVLAFSDGEYRNEGRFLQGVIHRLGKAALIAVGNVQIILSSIRVQPADRAALHLFGLEPENCPVVAVKSAVHYRASYEPVAGKILEVETPGLGPIDPRALHYVRAPKEFYPLQGM